MITTYQEQLPNVFRIGSRWGKNGPSIHHIFRETNIVFIGLGDCNNPESFWKSIYSIKKGDFILIMLGTRVVDIACVESNNILVGEELRNNCTPLKEEYIDYMGDNSYGVHVSFPINRSFFCTPTVNDDLEPLTRNGQPHRNIQLFTNCLVSLYIKLFSTEDAYSKRISVLSLRELYIAKQCKLLDIPPVQRGLVWNPSQIVNLWDSIFNRYPIGTFIVYRDETGKCALLDGQQRLNAIHLGFAADNDMGAKLWIKKKEGDTHAEFYLTTQNHPWGYKCAYENEQWELKPFSPTNKSEANNTLCGRIIPSGDFSISSDQYPFTTGNRDKDGISTFKIEDCQLMTDFILNSCDKDIVDTPCVPLIWCNFGKEKGSAQNIHQLFSRINKGGTPLSTEDEIFSTICVYWCTLKYINDEISQKFLPPPRLMNLAARLANCLAKDELNDARIHLYLPPVAPKEICKWSKSREGEKLEKLYKKGERDVSPLESMVQTFRKQCGYVEYENVDNPNRFARYLPHPVYLNNDHKDAWLVVMFYVLHKFFDDGRTLPENESAWPLFFMLPDVMCAEHISVSRFCTSFFRAMLWMDKESHLLRDVNDRLWVLLAIGCASSAIEWDENTFSHVPIFPTSEKEKSLKIDETALLYDDVPEHYLASWRNMWVMRLAKSENVLMYYQRVYIGMMCASAMLSPEQKNNWSGVHNTPWDVDHVVPASWWKNDDDNALKNGRGNKQFLYFSDNRRKNNRYAGAPVWETNLDLWKESFHYENEKDWESLSEPVSEEHKEKVRERFMRYCYTLYNDLKIPKLIDYINSLAKDVESLTDNFNTSGIIITSAPVFLHSAIIRYIFFKRLYHQLKPNEDYMYAAEQFVPSRSKEHNKRVLSIDAPECFYESLTPYLALGHEKNGKFICCESWITQTSVSSSDGVVQLGSYLRGIESNSSEWHSDEQYHGLNNIWSNMPDSIYAIAQELMSYNG